MTRWLPSGEWILARRGKVIDRTVPPAQALMVGDHEMDVQAGRNAGMHAALITNGAAPEDLDRIAPDHVFETPAGLLRLF